MTGVTGSPEAKTVPDDTGRDLPGAGLRRGLAMPLIQMMPVRTGWEDVRQAALVSEALQDCRQRGPHVQELGWRGGRNACSPADLLVSKAPVGADREEILF